MDVEGMYKRIDVHLLLELYKEVKKQPQGITQTVCTALTQYLHNDYTKNTHTDDRYLKHLEGEIVYLRGIHNKVMDRVTLLPEVVEMPQSDVSDVPSANSGDIVDEINHVIKERSEDIVKTEKKKGFLGRLWG